MYLEATDRLCYRQLIWQHKMKDPNAPKSQFSLHLCGHFSGTTFEYDLSPLVTGRNGDVSLMSFSSNLLLKTPAKSR